MNTNDGWLMSRAEIAAKIERGFAQAERGELVDGDEVWARLNERKQAWMDQNNRE